MHVELMYKSGQVEKVELKENVIRNDFYLKGKGSKQLELVNSADKQWLSKPYGRTYRWIEAFLKTKGLYEPVMIRGIQPSKSK